MLLPGGRPSVLRAEGAGAPTLDGAFESRLRDRERSELSLRWTAARASIAQRTTEATGRFSPMLRRSALPAMVQVGDMVTVNVNGVESCTNPIYRRARVAAVGAHSIILADSL